MTEESVNLPLEDTQNLEYHIVTLFEKLEAIRLENVNSRQVKISMQVEIRTLEFWRAVICECLASFVYVFIVCGAASGAGANATLSSILLATALSSGFTMTTLIQCFGHISGAHVNPAVSIAMGITKKISLLRTCMFIVAQCGGGIAGAAFLYGVTVPGYQGNLTVANANVATWERFGVEFMLTFVIVLTYFVSMDRRHKWTSNPAITIGAAYTACSFVSMPYLNPARSLGPSFVLSKFDNHWVYLLGPSIGGAVSGLLYDYVLNPRHRKSRTDSTDGDSSIHSDEDTYDDLDKPTPPKFHGSTYNTYRPTAVTTNTATAGYCPSLTSASLYSVPPSKLERVESLYGGTKSLYCKSPPLTRANLNRSQSVYTKSNSAVNKDNTLPRPGPLVPAQSLYPMRLNQPSQIHVQNQNVQNQMQQHSESIYGVRGVTPGTSTRTDKYAATREAERAFPARSVTGGNADNKFEENQKQPPRARPDSMYGTVGSNQRRAQSDDSNYGSYHGPNQRNPTSSSASTYNSTAYPPKSCPKYTARPGGSQEVRKTPPAQLLSTASASGTYHHALPQHSPNSPY